MIDIDDPLALIKTLTPLAKTVTSPGKDGDAKKKKGERYQIISIKGSGSFGVVFKAKDRRGRVVAIKRTIYDPRYRDREGEVISSLDHPNCVACYEVFQQSDKATAIILSSFVMEYIPNDLCSFNELNLESRKRPHHLVFMLFAFQLFAGLEHMHSKGFVHRDICPHNILINMDTCELKICDFGSAKSLASPSRSVSYIGNRFYRAPELLLESNEYGPAVDIWSAACVIVEMMTGGNLLFKGDSVESQLEAIVNVLGTPTEDDLNSFQHSGRVYLPRGDPVPLERVIPHGIPSELLGLMRKIFVFNPNKRPTALECMKHSYFDPLFNNHYQLPNGNPLPPLNRDPTKQRSSPE